MGFFDSGLGKGLMVAANPIMAAQVLSGADGGIGSGLLNNMTGSFGAAMDPKNSAAYKGQMAPIQQYTTPEQIQEAQKQTAAGLAQQQAFVQALQTQNGIGNQSAVFNQLQGVANGQGPNPALAQLQQQTANNVNQQAALMGSQRGVGANSGLLARQAAQQGANIQQNAAGQAATMQANQSLGALNQMGGIAGQQVANQQGGLNALNQFANTNQSNLLNSGAAYNNALASSQGSVNSANAGIAGKNIESQQMFAKGLAGALGGAGGGMGMASGGMAGRDGVPMNFFEGGMMEQPMMPSGPQSAAGQFLSAPAVPQVAVPGIQAVPASPMMASAPQEAQQQGPDKKKMAMSAAKLMMGVPPMAEGGAVPGKAEVPGDSLKNDKVKALLSPGEIVIPRSITMGKDAPNKAAAFVAAVLAKQGKKK